MPIFKSIKYARITWLIVALNSLLFTAVIFGIRADVLTLSASPAVDFAEPWRPVSYMFLHSYTLHFLCNMAALILIGAWFESRRTGINVLMTYFVAGIAGAMTFIATGAIAGSDATLSGCSASVLGLAACALCDRRFSPRYWQIILVVAIFIAATGVAGPNPGGSLAHVAGILAGALIGRSFKTSINAAATAKDPLISKAEQSGFSSLSESERAQLFFRNQQ